MAVFYSFHYDRDVTRYHLIRNMGVVEGQRILNSQEWEDVKKRGDAAIERWIDEQMKFKRAVVVLIGAQTASRPWVNYEIHKAWDEKKPLVGVYIHRLKDISGNTDFEGADPFALIKAGDRPLSTWVPRYLPSGVDSQAVYADINANLNRWVESAYARP